jgi:hypothetical protein
MARRTWFRSWWSWLVVLALVPVLIWTSFWTGLAQLSPTPLPEALDGDRDGVADVVETALGSNPASAASTPESVASPPSCLNGSDDDGDGQTDLADPGCTVPPPVKTAFPAAGQDVFDSSLRLDDYVFDAGSLGTCTFDFTARGPVVVQRGAPQDAGGGLRSLDVEIVAMQLTGTLTIAPGASCLIPPATIDGITVLEDPAQQTLGKVNDTNSDPAVDFPAQSFFDVFFLVNTPAGLLPGGPPNGMAGQPVRVTNEIATIPPYHSGNNPLCYQVPGLNHEHCPKAPPDHFACYTGKFPKFQKRQVTLRDQFHPTAVETTVVKPFLLCNPAAKNGEPLYEETGHLQCYKTKAEKVKRTVLVRNQFGQRTVSTKKTNILCLPSGKDDLANPQELDHFQCYTGKFPKVQPRSVTLVDQFGTLTARATKPFLLCNPVDKNGEGIRDRLNHLECYKLAPPPKVARTVTVRNQFGESSVGTKKAVVMCVPSSKVETETTTTTVPDGNTTTTSTTIPTIITELTLAWDHVQPGVMSIVCGRANTTPPQAGVSAQATLTRPDNSMTSTNFTTNGSGVGRFQFDIFTFGTYGVDVSVDTAGGPSVANGMVSVTGAGNTCP